MKRTIALLFSLALVLFCACSATPPPSTSTADSSSASEAKTAHLLTPYSIAGAGYELRLPTAVDIGIAAAAPLEIVEGKCCFEQAFQNIAIGKNYLSGTYGSQPMVGDYTVIQPHIFNNYTQDTNLALTVLQVFLQSELQKPGGQVQFLTVQDLSMASTEKDLYQVPIEDLQEYLVFSDSTIAVYNFTGQCNSLTLEQQLVLPEINLDGEAAKQLLLVRDYFASLSPEQWSALCVPKAAAATSGL